MEHSNNPNGDDAVPAVAPAAAPAAALDKKKSLILGLVGLIFIVIIFWKVIPMIGSYSEAWNSLQSMGTLSILLIVMMVLLYLAMYGLPFVAAAPGLKYWLSLIHI